MAKFHGSIGYITTEETRPGIWEEVITERECVGDLLRDNKTSENNTSVNSNPDINNKFSIVGDFYANENFQHMRYILWNNIKWNINAVEVQYPRLIITVRGRYG